MRRLFTVLQCHCQTNQKCICSDCPVPAFWMLEPQENLPPVKKPTEQQNQTRRQDRDPYRAKRTEACLNRPTPQTGSHVCERKKLPGQVNCDRIHSDPDERLSPFLEFPDVDHLIKNRQKEAAIAGGYQHIRRGPKFLNHWELQAPEKPQHYTHHPCQTQPGHLSLITHLRVFEE